MAQRKNPALVDNPTVRYTELNLDGEVYKLIFDFNSIAAAEQVARVNLLEALDFRGMTAAQYRGLLWAALMKKHPTLSLADAGDLITMRRLQTITDALLRAWKASNGIDDEEENPPGPVAGEASGIAAAG